MKRSGGVENLAETGSSSGTDEGASTLGRGRSRSRSNILFPQTLSLLFVPGVEVVEEGSRRQTRRGSWDPRWNGGRVD